MTYVPIMLSLTIASKNLLPAGACRALLLLLLLLLSSRDLFSQNGPADSDLLELFPPGDDYFFDVAVLPGKEAKERVVVMFRLTYDLLPFTKASRGGVEKYVSSPTIIVEAIGDDGVIAGHARWSGTVETPEYARTLSKKEFAAASLELALRPGRYVLTYTIDGGSAGATFTVTSQPFEVVDYRSDAVVLGRPIVIDGIDESAFVASIIDGNASFGDTLRAFVPIAGPAPPPYLRYDIVESDSTGERGETLASGTASISAPLTVASIAPAGDGVRFLFGSAEGGAGSEEPTESVGLWGGVIEHDAGGLPEGAYVMELRYQIDGVEHLDTMRFLLRWVDRPLSLGNLSYAINALRPIATDEEIDRLKRVDDASKRRALNEFWSGQDPTPATLYNERMAEYYRRVDYAHFNFATFSDVDGAVTDRGKIYILYGPPTDVARRLDPDSRPQEIWTYRNAVGQEFVFHDRNESGEYRLVEYYDL